MEVWKLKLSKKASLRSIEAALADACKKVIEEAHPEGPVGLLERVDFKEKETIVFMSGNEITAKAFSNILKKQVSEGKVTSLKVSQMEVLKFDE